MDVDRDTAGITIRPGDLDGFERQAQWSMEVLEAGRAGTPDGGVPPRGAGQDEVIDLRFRDPDALAERAERLGHLMETILAGRHHG